MKIIKTIYIHCNRYLSLAKVQALLVTITVICTILLDAPSESLVSFLAKIGTGVVTVAGFAVFVGALIRTYKKLLHEDFRNWHRPIGALAVGALIVAFPAVVAAFRCCEPIRIA